MIFHRLVLMAVMGASAPVIGANDATSASEKQAEALERWRDKPVPDTWRTVRAPIVKPIPPDQLLSYRTQRPRDLPFEFDAERGWLDRRR